VVARDTRCRRGRRTIAELGIGTNPGATITGVILEDEKAEGTVHFAFGTNTGIGGGNRASVHIDGLVREAMVELDGRLILRNGVLSTDVMTTLDTPPLTPQGAVLSIWAAARSS
jgi:leucyl aminopeptidase (aminopeptidase T)